MAGMSQIIPRERSCNRDKIKIWANLKHGLFLFKISTELISTELISTELILTSINKK